MDDIFRAPYERDFVQGRHYAIKEKNNSHVFEYLGKQGIHHCFKSVRGGWTRTYTDYQLIGKTII